MAPTKPSSFTARLELGRDGVRALHRQCGKTGKAVGMARDGFGQMIVDGAGERDAVGAGHQIGGRAGVRQHLHRDARIIHGFEASLADLG